MRSYLTYLLHMQTLSFSTVSAQLHQTLNTSVSESLDTLDIVHTVVFPEGRTLGVMVDYNIIATDSSSTVDINQKNFTIEAIELNPFTDAAE